MEEYSSETENAQPWTTKAFGHTYSSKIPWIQGAFTGQEMGEK
jgi:hypothetical protein